MDIDITDFFETARPLDYSASAAELGRDAGKITWGNAVRDSADYMLLDTEEKREEWRDDVRGFGAWEEEEIAAWSDEELNALFIQFISGDIREMRALCADNWDEFERLVEQGTCSGRLSRDADGRVWFYVGS